MSHHATFVWKTDSNVFVNMRRLLTFVKFQIRGKYVIFDRVSESTNPLEIRRINTMSRSNYKQEVMRPAYLLSNDTIHRLYVESLNTNFLKLEDKFIIGIVDSNLKIKLIDANEFTNQRESCSLCEL